MKRLFGAGVAGASTGNMVSTAAGLLRDGLVIVVLGISRQSDRFFLLFAILQFGYVLLLGGTRLVQLQTALADTLSLKGANESLRQLEGVWQDKLRRVTLHLSVTMAIVGFAICKTAALANWECATIAGLVALTVWWRTEAEIGTCRLLAAGLFGRASWATVAQNGAIVATALVALVLSHRSSSLLLWVGVAVGYWLNARLIGGRAGSREDALRSQPVAFESGKHFDGSGLRLLATQLTALQGAPLFEQAALNAMGTGTATLFVLARRIASVIFTVLLVPLGAVLLVRRNEAARDPTGLAATRIWSLVALLSLLSLLISGVLVDGMWMTFSIWHKQLAISSQRGRELEKYVILCLPGSFGWGLQAALGRASQAAGDYKGPLRRTVVASGIHCAGVGLILGGAPVRVALVAYSAGWIGAAFAEWRQFRIALAPAPKRLRQGLFPAVMIGVAALIVTATLSQLLLTPAITRLVVLAALLGAIASLVVVVRRVGDLAWL